MRIFTAVFLMLASVAAVAQSTPATTPQPQPSAQAPTIASVLDRRLSGIEKQFIELADAMPEDKFNFAPTQGEFKGVRTFAEQVKHVAATNYMFFGAMLGEKKDAGAGENGPANLKTKTEIMKYLRDSFAYGHTAIKAITDQNAVAPIPSPFGRGQANRLGLAVLTVGHCFDHYGQMVVYLRMNGIIPPASRGQQ